MDQDTVLGRKEEEYSTQALLNQYSTQTPHGHTTLAQCTTTSQARMLSRECKTVVL
jgi:hypothetical protein